MASRTELAEVFASVADSCSEVADSIEASETPEADAIRAADAIRKLCDETIQTLTKGKDLN